MNTVIMDSLNLKLCYSENRPESNKNIDKFQHRPKPFQDSDIFEGHIEKFEKLTKGDDVEIFYEAILKVDNYEYNFHPGAAIAIFPENDDIEVDKLLTRLKLDKVCDKYYEIKALNGKKLPQHVPSGGITLRQLFLKYVDIRSISKKLFLKSLLDWTTEYVDKTKLEFICSPLGSKAYEQLISTKRSLLLLLEEFPSCHPSVELILKHSTSLKPRYFSIASSPLQKNKLSIIFSVLELENGLKGVCTGWLQKILEKNVSNTEKRISFYFRKNSGFQIGDNSEEPKIFIASGTGIAPFIGFLRYFDEKRKNSGDIWLFFGCRYKDRDFLCKNEIEGYSKQGLIKLDTAFSREQNTKHYIQDEILKNASEFVSLILEKNANVYVCGNAKTMVKDVRKTIVDCISKVKNVDFSVAEDIFECNLVKTKKYVVDSWI